MTTLFQFREDQKIRHRATGITGSVIDITCHSDGFSSHTCRLRVYFLFAWDSGEDLEIESLCEIEFLE